MSTNNVVVHDVLLHAAAHDHFMQDKPIWQAMSSAIQVPDKDEFSQSKRQMMARIDVCMGGKVAEEVIFGRDSVTSGARSDLQQATSLARHMVTECGMSDELGKLALLLLVACFACHAAQRSTSSFVVRGHEGVCKQCMLYSAASAVCCSDACNRYHKLSSLCVRNLTRKTEQVFVCCKNFFVQRYTA